MKTAGTTLSNYMGGLDHSMMANMGQRTRTAAQQATMLADGKATIGGIRGLGAKVEGEIMSEASRYASGQAQQAAIGGSVMDLIGQGVGIAGEMGAFGGSGSVADSWSSIHGNKNPFSTDYGSSKFFS